MVEQLSETMPEDVRQAFADAVRLYSHWRFEPPNLPTPTLGFRTLKVSLSGICDLALLWQIYSRCFSSLIQDRQYGHR